MRKSLFASLGLFGTSALAFTAGSAVISNQCPYDVYVFNVPAVGGGYGEEDSVIASGGTWSQPWTQLLNGDGWAIKMSMVDAVESILQYEYTFHDDGSIWFDLSAVNGDPWNGDWNVVANGFNCTPKYAAYQYPTDDVHAMQWCVQEASVTAVLCASQAQSASSTWTTSTTSTTSITVAPATSSPAESLTTSPESVAPVTSETPTVVTSQYLPSFTHDHSHTFGYDEYAAVAATTPTTFATSASVSAEEFDGVTIWEVETAVVTALVTAFYTEEPPSRIKRHEHHAAHQHAF